jgi:hypothetical protein
MIRGERFVLDVLRGKARTRERWIVGAPGLVIALLGLWCLSRRYRMPGRNSAGADLKAPVASSGVSIGS